MPLPSDYVERVYAGVLGKMIGVYLGRPFEGWDYDRIMAELGEIQYYVHEKRGVPLVVTDDDLSGTFTFIRALEDYRYNPALSAEQIGQTWLNYLVEQRTILWWGGLGNSTEHTAYMRLKKGVRAPLSGSMKMNGKVVAEQIGAQIFIDGWALVNPGDPQRAADFARRAGSVSHDGEAIYGAQVIAALEAQAFVEQDRDRLLDTAVGLIPHDSVIYRLIADLRDWRAAEPDWRVARQRVVQNYGYDRYIHNCHMVPNHALIILAFLYGDDQFQKTLMIGNTCGWDTDCNAGNLGCLMGIKLGLGGINAGPDWRGPVADRVYVAAADGGRVVSDAVLETYHLVNAGRGLQGLPALQPKHGARFHFSLPGSVQGWQAESGTGLCEVLVENVVAPNTFVDSSGDHRCLALRVSGMAETASAAGLVGRVSTATFLNAEGLQMPGYALMASPTLYPGQIVYGRLAADAANSGPLSVKVFTRHYGAGNQLVLSVGKELLLAPGTAQGFEWTVADTGGCPIAEVGVEIGAPGSIYLDFLGWHGRPQVVFQRPVDSPPGPGSPAWRKAWVNGVDHWENWAREPFRLIQNDGRGMLLTGTREWKNLSTRCEGQAALAKAWGVAVRVQGMQRYYALLLCADQKARLIKSLDGEQVLAEVPFDWNLFQRYTLELDVAGNVLQARVDGRQLFSFTDRHGTLDCGGTALIIDEGTLMVDSLAVR